MAKARIQERLDPEDGDFEVKEYTSRDLLTEVNGILATIDGSEGVINQDFRDCCVATIRMVDKERFLQGWASLTGDEKIILVHEMFRTYLPFKDKKRHSGTNYFFDHLYGTVEFLVKEEGLVGLASIIAAFKHDNVEDLIDVGVVESAVFAQVQHFIDKAEVLDEIGPVLSGILESSGGNWEQTLVEAGPLIGGWMRNKKYSGVLRQYGLDDLGRLKSDKAFVRLRKFVWAAERCCEIARRLRPVFEKVDSDVEVGERLEGFVEEFEDDPEIYAMLMRYVSEAKVPEERRLYKELVDLEFYRHKLSSYSDAALHELKENVVTYLSGVTKFRKAREEKTTEATFERLLAVSREAIRVVYLKLADRGHNVLTLDGHGDTPGGRAKKAKIMRETREQYLSLARVCRIRNMIRFFTEMCCKFENPELFADFERFAMDRRGALSKSTRSRVMKKLGGIRTVESSIDAINLVPFDLSKYTTLIDLANTFFSELALDDFEIGEFDPMEEFLITFRLSDQQYEQIEKVARKSALKEFNELKRSGRVEVEVGEDEEKNPVMRNLFAVKYRETLVNFRLKAINEIEAHVKAAFASTERCYFESDIAPSNMPEHMEGKRIVCFNPDLGRLRFRVNEVYAEARSKRGVLAESMGGKTPDDVVAMINDLLQKSAGDFKGRRGVKARAKEELLKPRITVYTPKGEAILLPQGSTSLDFAAAVHTRLVTRMIGVLSFDSLGSMEKGKPVDMFAPLEDGKVYQVKTGDQSMVRPEWLLFANSAAAGAIRGKLADISDGEDYVVSLSKVFNIAVDDLRKILAERYHKLDILEITNRVGAGKINPVLALAEYIDLQGRKRKRIVKSSKQFRVLRKSEISVEEFEPQVQAALSDISKWEIEVIIPEVAGSLSGFSREFTEKEGFKIDWFKSHEPGREGKPGVLHLVFDLKDADITTYEFLVKVIKLNFKYPVRIAVPIDERFRGHERSVGEVRGKLGRIDVFQVPGVGVVVDEVEEAEEDRGDDDRKIEDEEELRGAGGEEVGVAGEE